MKQVRYHMNLPDFMASLHDLDPFLVQLVERVTRQKIDEERPIIFADARHGYYVVADFIIDKDTNDWKHTNFVAVNNNSFVVRRFTDESMKEYYDSDEMYG